MMHMPPYFDWEHVAYYEHYKGGRYILQQDWMGYLEEDYGKEDVPEDMQEVVMYRSLDEPKKRVWVRRRAYFFGKVAVHGQIVPRFREVTWKEAFLRNEGRLIR